MTDEDAGPMHWLGGLGLTFLSAQEQRQARVQRFILEQCHLANVSPADYLAWLKKWPYSVEDGWGHYVRAGCPEREV